MSAVGDLLSETSAIVRTISESATVLAAVKDMSKYGVSCLVVARSDGAISGIVAEQDVIRRMARDDQNVAELLVQDVMTTEVIVCRPADSLNTVRSIMKTHAVRQLPVITDEGKVGGIITMDDVNAHLISDEELEITFLHEYIEGVVR